MGSRVKGRVKKKSIKAASHSKMGSKRKLSRMGKKQKKHNAGVEASFIGRSRCLKILQITIKDFRRLCILKGVYPREPRGRTPGNKKGQTFYHINDVKALAHEPLLDKFRQFRSFMKKVRRAAGRNETDEAIRKNAVCPTYSLTHLVRERYPRFVDALADMDDALTLTYLFASLPADKRTGIKPSVIASAKSLAAAWGAYCATTGAITKSFVSVKGVYLEASVGGATVTGGNASTAGGSNGIRWIVPHAFVQFLPEDVDYRVMSTFLEFYETLLSFVLFKLYNDIGLRYPLVRGASKGTTSIILGEHLKSLSNAMDAASSNAAIASAVNDAIVSKDVGEASNKLDAPKKSSKSEKRKQRELVKTIGDALADVHEDEGGADDDDEADDDNEVEETNVTGPLSKAFADIAADQDNNSENVGGVLLLDSAAQGRRRLFAGLTFYLSREVPRGYLELVCLAFGGKVGWEGPNSPIAANDPSITHHIIDRPKIPASFDKLPKSREYVQPQWVLDCANNTFLLPVSRYAVGAKLPPHLSPWVDNEEEGYTPAYAKVIAKLKNGEVVSENEEVEDEERDESEEESVVADEKIDQVPTEDEEVAKEDADDSDDDSDDEEKKKEKLEKKRKREAKEAHELAKSMMSRKATHLYKRMQHGISQKQADVDRLTNRREELVTSKKKDKAGRTASMQKVIRLKNERKKVEDEYTETGGTMKKSKRRRKKESS